MVAGRFRRHSHPIRFDPISFLPSLSSFLSIQSNSTVKTVAMAVLLLFDRAACFFPLLFRIPIRLFLDLAQFHWSLHRTSSPPLPPPSGSHSRYVFFSSLLFDLWLGFKIHNSANKKRRDIKETRRFMLPVSMPAVLSMRVFFLWRYFGPLCPPHLQATVGLISKALLCHEGLVSN
ncbi:unnamed protein product [Musa acuminata subsp. malaccensis]|uniref:(wild Malaysian banana) hypothetical protein n=1 Tax=Musa acuminata subsp. malaccensis TaxID=214687 RepID=A0A8D7F8J2_MUSAM|nr:unnamed protein product [Musa acuminata subsp. malaccensis]